MQMGNAIKNALVFIALFPFKVVIRLLAILLLTFNIIFIYTPMVLVEAIFGWRSSPLLYIADFFDICTSRLFDLSDC